MKTLTLGTAVLSVAFAVAALAQASATNPAVNPGGAKMPNGQFSSLDTNKDGRVSKDEVKSHADITSSFGTLDSDRDNYLSETEFGKWKPMSSSPGATMPGATIPGNTMPGAGKTMPNDGMSKPGNGKTSPGTSPQSTASPQGTGTHQ